MLKKLTALLICAVMLSLSVTVNAAENYTKEDISKTIDGIISYKSAILKADDTASFVQKLSETTDNSETQWYIISLSKYGTDVTAVQSSMIKSAEKLYKSKLQIFSVPHLHFMPADLILKISTAKICSVTEFITVKM